MSSSTPQLQASLAEMRASLITLATDLETATAIATAAISTAVEDLDEAANYAAFEGPCQAVGSAITDLQNLVLNETKRLRALLFQASTAANDLARRGAALT